MNKNIPVYLSELQYLCKNVIQSVCIGKPNASLNIFDELVEKFQTEFDNHIEFCTDTLKNTPVVCDISNTEICMLPKMDSMHDLVKYTLIVSKFLIPNYLEIPDIEDNNEDENSTRDYVKWRIIRHVKNMTFEQSSVRIVAIMGKIVTLQFIEQLLRIPIYKTFPMRTILHGCIDAETFEKFRENNRKSMETLDIIFKKQKFPI